MIVVQKPPWKPSLAPLDPLPSPWQKRSFVHCNESLNL